MSENTSQHQKTWYAKLSKTERAAYIAKQSAYNARRKTNASTSQNIRDSGAARKRDRHANESAEQREIRLKKRRTYEKAFRKLHVTLRQRTHLENTF